MYEPSNGERQEQGIAARYGPLLQEEGTTMRKSASLALNIAKAHALLRNQEGRERTELATQLAEEREEIEPQG